MNRTSTGVKVVLLCTLALGLSSCEPSGKSKSSSKSKTGLLDSLKKGPISVSPYTVLSKEVPLVISEDGQTEVGDRYEAKAPENTKVEKVFVEEGATVQPGDPLIKFDDENRQLKLSKARADLQEAQAGLDYAAVLQRNQNELPDEEKGVTATLEELDSRMALFQATMERARAEIELYEQSESLTELNSPISGVVQKKEASEGDEVSEGEVLIEIVRMDPMQFVFEVTVDSVVGLEQSPEIEIRFPALVGQDFSGEIQTIGSDVKGSGGFILVKVKVPNSPPVLRSGMAGHVKIRTAAKKKILYVPEASLLKTDKSQFVFKIDGDHVKKIPVDIGDTVNGQVPVTKGLAEGDNIVAVADSGLKDGSLIQLEAASVRR